MSQDTMYVITIQRHYYDGTLNVSRKERVFWHDQTGAIIRNTRDEAQAVIDEIDGSQYTLRHGEHSRPTFRVRSANIPWVKARIRKLEEGV